MWNASSPIPELTSVENREPNERDFTIMPVSGHLLRVLDVYPLKAGGRRTPMHRTQTLDYVVPMASQPAIAALDRSRCDTAFGGFASVIATYGPVPDDLVAGLRATDGILSVARIPA